MKLTKNDLKQLIREMMEAEEMEAEVEETEGDSEGKIRIKAELRDDPAFEAAQEDAVGNDYGGQNTYEMAKYIVTLPDGDEVVIPDLRTLEDVEGDAVIGKAFGMAQGYEGGTEEDKIEGFKGAQGPGGIGEDGELIDNERGTFQVFIDGFEIPKAGPASDELIKAFKKYKNRKPRYVSYKSTSRGPSRRKQYYDTYKEMPGGGPRSRSGYDRRYFKENKLTQSRLKQMIRETMFGEQLNEQIKDALTGRDITKSVLDAQFTDDTMKRIKSGQLVVYRDEEGTPQTVTPGGLQVIKGMISRAKKGPARPDVQGPPESATDFITKGVIDYTPVEEEIERQKPLPTDQESRQRLANKIYKKYMGLARTRRDKRKLRKAILQDMGLASDDSTPERKFQGQKPQRRRGRKPIFLRKYREYKNMMNDKFGGTDEDAFNRFYNAVKMPNNRRYRDYQFGRTHAKYFDAYVGKLDQEQQASEKAKKKLKFDRSVKTPSGDLKPPKETEAEKTAADKLEKRLSGLSEQIEQIIREELKKKF